MVFSKHCAHYGPVKNIEARLSPLPCQFIFLARLWFIIQIEWGKNNTWIIWLVISIYFQTRLWFIFQAELKKKTSLIISFELSIYFEARLWFILLVEWEKLLLNYLPLTGLVQNNKMSKIRFEQNYITINQTKATSEGWSVDTVK